MLDDAEALLRVLGDGKHENGTSHVLLVDGLEVAGIDELLCEMRRDGSALHFRVCTSRHQRRIRVHGGQVTQRRREIVQARRRALQRANRAVVDASAQRLDVRRPRADVRRGSGEGGRDDASNDVRERRLVAKRVGERVAAAVR